VRAHRWVTVVGLSCLLLVGGPAAPASAAAFKVDPSRSSLVVQIFRDGAAAKLGHDHVVQATTLAGRVTYDPSAPTLSSVAAEVRTATLTVDDAETRRKFGLEAQPSTKDVAEIDKSMKAEGQLDVAKFPLITFTSTTITPQAQDRYLVTGRLTIRGVTRAVQFPANVVMKDNVFRATATLTFMQSAFGYKPYSALLGAIKNKDAVMLHIDLVAVPE
jgi:polyisoprenoid-binding protein YceI